MRQGSRGSGEIRRLGVQEERVAMGTTASGGSRSTIWFGSIGRRSKSTITGDSIVVREPMEVIAIRIGRSGGVEVNHHKSILRSGPVPTFLHGDIRLESSIIFGEWLANRDYPSTEFEVDRKECRRIE